MIFFSQFPILRWPRPRFFGQANRRGFGPQNQSYVSHCRDFIQFRKVAGRSGSKKVRFFLHRFSRKMGIQTVIEVVLGTLFSFGCDACFLIFFFFFLVHLGKKTNGPKNVTFQFFVGPFLMTLKSIFSCLRWLWVLRWAGACFGSGVAGPLFASTVSPQWS